MSLGVRPTLTTRTADGRAYFTVPNLFEVSLCLHGRDTQHLALHDTGAESERERERERDGGWFFVHVEFLIGVGGDLTGVQGVFCLFGLAASYSAMTYLQSPF